MYLKWTWALSCDFQHATSQYKEKGGEGGRMTKFYFTLRKIFVRKLFPRKRLATLKVVKMDIKVIIDSTGRTFLLN